MPASYCAPRFSHPDFDYDGGQSGLQTGPGGGIDMIDGAASVRQSLLLLLTTQPGERVMLPRYGCDLYKLAFATNDDTTAGLAIHYVRLAIATWEPRVEILGLDATRSEEDPAILVILLDYRARPNIGPDRLLLPVDLMRAAL